MQFTDVLANAELSLQLFVQLMELLACEGLLMHFTDTMTCAEFLSQLKFVPLQLGFTFSPRQLAFTELLMLLM